MTRIPLLLTACLVAACDSDTDDARFRAADNLVLCDEQLQAFFVKPGIGVNSLVVRKPERDIECARRVMFDGVRNQAYGCNADTGECAADDSPLYFTTTESDNSR